MPLTPFQASVLRLIAINRSAESHLAGASAIHAAASSLRYSGDLDLFHDSVEAVARAYGHDAEILVGNGYHLQVRLSQPGFIRALVERDANSVLIDWAQDSAWRFMPPVPIASIGFVLHPVDLAVNKVLALGGRDEPRDWVDVLYLDQNLISLGALVFAAVGKDPGLNPCMLLELLGRKGYIQSRDLERIRFARPPDLPQLRQQWTTALRLAREFVESRPPDEAGHLYIHPQSGRFFAPAPPDAYVLHGPSEGGVLPRIWDTSDPSMRDSMAAKRDLEQFFGSDGL